jgi:hypothetical protein
MRELATFRTLRQVERHSSGDTISTSAKDSKVTCGRSESLSRAEVGFVSMSPDGYRREVAIS